MDFKHKIQSKLNEVWEKALAGGYSKETDLTNAEAKLDNSKEEIPGETEFPTYTNLLAIRSKMKKPQKLFTSTYDEFLGDNDNG